MASVQQFVITVWYVITAKCFTTYSFNFQIILRLTIKESRISINTKYTSTYLVKKFALFPRDHLHTP